MRMQNTMQKHERQHRSGPSKRRRMMATRSRD